MTKLRIGSLFSGYGGLDLGVQAVLHSEVVWHVEFDAAPSRVLAHHWPTVPNYGDITLVDWSKVEPVDILTGGFPCQDVSLAGARKGLKEGTRSGLWSYFAAAIGALRPSLVVIENVRGLLSATAGDTEEWTDEEISDLELGTWAMGGGERSDRPVLRAIGAVLGDLADLGYDAQWCGVRAADAGAPHGRFRVFILAWPADTARVGWGQGWTESAGLVGRPDAALGGHAVADPFDVERERESATVGRIAAATGGSGGAVADAYGERGGEGGAGSASVEGAEVPDARRARGSAADTSGERLGEQPGGASAEEAGTVEGHELAGDRGSRAALDWGPYARAIRRWEHVTGRVAPAPTRPDGKNGQHRLSPLLVEWMMGLPLGWVTDPAIWEGMSAGAARNAQLKALGNGVVPQQSALGMRILLHARNGSL